MAKVSFVLLPGLDGTATLFHRFINAAPVGLDLRPVRLPAEPLTYDQLAVRIADQLPEGPVVVVAESFSGPIAVALALYLRGTEDRWVPESACRRMAATRSITTARLPGPHLLLQANPKGAWDAIGRFLDSAGLSQR